ncbi:MAG: CopG family transcriptional regulator [Candidatus Aenigmatarchaeota archaeon]|nr:MAG: CopG family transcriptional regulator [Candidatus Aenigmarchaeota archaeon]
MPKGYSNVSIPTELFKEVEKIVKDKFLGYRSASEFVIEAVRRRVEEIEKLKIEKRKL